MSPRELKHERLRRQSSSWRTSSISMFSPSRLQMICSAVESIQPLDFGSSSRKASCKSVISPWPLSSPFCRDVETAVRDGLWNVAFPGLGSGTWGRGCARSATPASVRAAHEDLHESIIVNLAISLCEHAVHIAADELAHLIVVHRLAQRLERVLQALLGDFSLAIGIEEVERCPHPVSVHDCGDAAKGNLAVLRSKMDSCITREAHMSGPLPGSAGSTRHARKQRLGGGHRNEREAHLVCAKAKNLRCLFSVHRPLTA